MMQGNKVLWISSEFHRRSEELAKILQIKFIYYFYTSEDISSRLQRYLILAYKFFKTVVTYRPKVLIIQNPSIILCIISILSKKIFKYRVIVDRHSNFMLTRNKNSYIYKLFIMISNFTIVHADLTIVTNEELKSMLHGLNPNILVLPDVLPVHMKKKFHERENKKNKVVFITSFGNDEPIEEIIKASNYIQENIEIYITGNFRKFGNQSLLQKAPPNVKFTGFVSQEKYIQLLNSANVIVVTTIQELTLTCGAYEAFALEKPLVLSNMNTLKDYFGDAPIYTSNKAEEIAKAVNRAVNNQAEIREKMRTKKVVLVKNWEQQISKLVYELERLKGDSHD